MSEKTFTQEEVNALVGKAREEGRTAKAKEFEGWISPDQFATKSADLTSKVSDLTTALNDANTKLTKSEEIIAEKDKALKGHETNAIKSKIAREVGLSWDAIEFLKGDDEATIRKSAEVLKTLVGVNVPPLADPEPPVGGNSDGDLRNMLKSMKGE